MFNISVRGHFDAAHALRGYKGKCENLHGHRFEAVVTLEIAELNEIGITYDFSELKRHFNEVLSRLDHVNLNETAGFKESNPSSENLARAIYNEMRQRLDPKLTIANVQVWESPDAWVTYGP